ncbi:MAG: alcohol dehydrogenase catalytic domain-containing protein [Haloferacaceae archaeon]
MRVAAIVGDDAPEGIEARERPDPTPGPGEAVVRVEACGLNHNDLWTLEADSAEGLDLPFVPGSDVAGVVSAVGDDVDGVASGDRVVLCPNVTCGTCRRCREGPENECESFSIYAGGFAERAVVDADRLVSLPDAVSFEDAAALPIAYMTARHMLRRAGVEPGDRVLVPGATGGVGVAAMQLAAVRGARAVGTTGYPAKRGAVESLTVEEPIVAGSPDELAEALSARDPFDVAVNHLGGPYSGPMLEALRRGGTMVVCGRTTGDESALNVADLFWEHKRVLGSSMGTQADLERLVDLVARGDLDPKRDSTFPLSDAAAAFDRMRERSLVGKVVLRPQD